VVDNSPLVSGSMAAMVRKRKHLHSRGEGETGLTDNEANSISGEHSAATDASTELLCTCLADIAERQDRTAFKTLFDYFAPRIKAYVMKLGTPPAQAEELVQETMLKVWRKAAQFDPLKAAPSTWIFRIARNQRIDAFRRDARPELDPHDPGLIPDAEPLPDAQLGQQQSEENVREAMATLPEEQKSILLLAFFEDLSHGEIAARLNIPLGTVKSRSRLALAKLRTYLDQQIDFSGPSV